MYVQLFNRQSGRKRAVQKADGPKENFDQMGLMDPGLDDLGLADHPSMYVAPGVIAHLGESGGAIFPRLERAGEMVDG